MGITNLLHGRCRQGKHTFWPPWYQVKTCLLCGRLERSEFGQNTITLEDELLKWSTYSTPSSGMLGMWTSNGRPNAYVNGASRYLAHLEENGIWKLVYSVDFSSPSSAFYLLGFDGNADEIIVVTARIKFPFNVGTYLYMRPNGSSTNLDASRMYSLNGTFSQGSSATMDSGLTLTATGTYTTVTLFIVIQSNYSVSGTTVGRSYFSLCGGAGATLSSGSAYAAGGSWSDTATNLTSLRMLCGTSMQAGTSFRAWKVENGS